MRLSTRYGLAAIAALAVLSSVDWVRRSELQLPPVGEYLVGVLPNFAAAIAIVFVVLSVWGDQHREADYASTRRAFLVCAAISGAGLIAWEVFQKTSTRLVFDPHDLAATVAGIGAASLIFYALSRRIRQDR